MTLSALKHFEPLGRKQLRANLGEQVPQQADFDETIALSLEDGSLTETENFCITLDQATLEKHSFISITNCENFTIYSSLTDIPLSKNNKFFVEITDCKHFTIEGLNCSTGRNMLFITDSSSFSVADCRCSNAEGTGITINNGYNFRVKECLFDNNLSACILIIGNSYNGEIRDCIFSRSRGFFNHDAAIHICHTSPNITSAHIPEKYHEPLPITSKTQRPHHIAIKGCNISNCRAQGIYLEGAVNCLIEENIILNNNKEGICFDWGSCYNIFCQNIVSLNGERRNLSPMEIKTDFITEYPLLKDGSSSMKLPGISLDNGCMNLIYGNKITSNYGGGIKMIRTALFNNISHNQILYNAIGSNEYIPYFHGITALGLGAVNKEFDTSRQLLLDFMPSILNTISHNTINESLLAIFYDKLSFNNFASDNIITQREQQPPRLVAYYFRFKAFVKRLVANLFRK